MRRHLYCRAFLWQNGKMYGLNNLVTNNSVVDLYKANFITDSGDITGEAYNDETSTDGAFLAIVTGSTTEVIVHDAEAGARVNLPESVRVRQQQRRLKRGGIFGARPNLAR